MRRQSMMVPRRVSSLEGGNGKAGVRRASMFAKSDTETVSEDECDNQGDPAKPSTKLAAKIRTSMAKVNPMLKIIRNKQNILAFAAQQKRGAGESIPPGDIASAKRALLRPPSATAVDPDSPTMGASSFPQKSQRPESQTAPGVMLGPGRARQSSVVGSPGGMGAQGRARRSSVVSSPVPGVMVGQGRARRNSVVDSYKVRRDAPFGRRKTADRTGSGDSAARSESGGGRSEGGREITRHDSKSGGEWLKELGADLSHSSIGSDHSGGRRNSGSTRTRGKGRRGSVISVKAKDGEGEEGSTLSEEGWPMSHAMSPIVANVSSPLGQTRGRRGSVADGGSPLPKGRRGSVVALQDESPLSAVGASPPAPILGAKAIARRGSIGVAAQDLINFQDQQKKAQKEKSAGGGLEFNFLENLAKFQTKNAERNKQLRNQFIAVLQSQVRRLPPSLWMSPSPHSTLFPPAQRENISIIWVSVREEREAKDKEAEEAGMGGGATPAVANLGCTFVRMHFARLVGVMAHKFRILQEATAVGVGSSPLSGAAGGKPGAVVVKVGPGGRSPLARTASTESQKKRAASWESQKKQKGRSRSSSPLPAVREAKRAGSRRTAKRGATPGDGVTEEGITRTG
eukprot:1347424-Rhodomonas_salina.3